MGPVVRESLSYIVERLKGAVTKKQKFNGIRLSK